MSVENYYINAEHRNLIVLHSTIGQSICGYCIKTVEQSSIKSNDLQKP